MTYTGSGRRPRVNEQPIQVRPLLRWVSILIVGVLAAGAVVLVGLGVAWISGGGFRRYWTPQDQVRPHLQQGIRRAAAGPAIDFDAALVDARAIGRLGGVSKVTVDRSSDGQEVAIGAMVHVPAAWLPVQDDVCLLAVGRLGIADVAVVEYPPWRGPCGHAAQLAMHPTEGAAASWPTTPAIDDARQAAARARGEADWEELRQVLKSGVGRLEPPYEVSRFREVVASLGLPVAWDVGIALQEGQAGIAFQWRDKAESDDTIYCVRVWFGPQGQMQAWRHGPGADCTAASVFARVPSNSA